MLLYISTAAPRARPLAQQLLRELHVSWMFIRRDLSTTIIPSLIFALTALKTTRPTGAGDVARVLLYGALYFWLYIYSFCLGDQLVGEEEDRVNKPDRPLPSGLVSRRGALVRLAVTTAAFLAVGAWLGVLKWAALWVFVSLAHNFGGWDKNWFTKNCVAMPLGNLAELAAAWEIARPLTSVGLVWLVVSPVFTFMTMTIQDFRDVDGDRLIGRRTLPMLLGDTPSRLLVAALHVAVLFVIHLGLRSSRDVVGLALCEIVIAAVDLVIVARLLLLRSPLDDHRTYMLYTYWYCFILTSGLLVL